ncbi:4a-hydroxytetrahydrobiopterin dehydratase [Pseudonocardia sp. WMMC193]|uniref:4a-hydroxytetrahydrobiopterin dehydratase n=1 Tax=Pseudonocardia sp. WMMC193 TaxID=2911965 RepID=UPI001F01F321|nr:4a-hydroxytetrahydrobiopterin dehydratase [Pseudonocardia sp. WMMC193]MCF7551177.1 4a-hydroxytetrahydrobiopterin dehydratase [Pseudonocardia sp. WMMC193]
MAALLSDAEITAALADLDGWERDGDAIVRTAELPSFRAAIAVVDRVAEDAEDRDHHPDIDIRWRTLTFRLSTHSEGGLTGKDTALAKKIDSRLAEAR